MKYLYILSFVIVCSGTARAQVNKGEIVLGGNIGYQDQASNGVTPPSPTTFHNLNINPSIGKAIRENLVLGLDLSYSHGSSGSGSGSQAQYSNASNGFFAGVFLRRYKGLGNGFYLFGQAEIGSGYSHTSTDNPASVETSYRSNSYSASFQLYPGIAYALNRHWQIEAGLPNFFAINYSHTRETMVYSGQNEQPGTNHYFSINSSLTGNNQFTVGIRYFIGG